MNPYRSERGRPQVWKTVPAQVLIRADPPFIKSFIVGFPSGTEVRTDWYAPLQRTAGPLWIWLQLEAVGRLWHPWAGCEVSCAEWKLKKTVSKAHWGANKCDVLSFLWQLDFLKIHYLWFVFRRCAGIIYFYICRNPVAFVSFEIRVKLLLPAASQKQPHQSTSKRRRAL